MTQRTIPPHTAADEDRRRFMAACGKFAIVTPPAVTMLLSTSLNSTAIAASAGGNDNDKDKDKDKEKDK